MLAGASDYFKTAFSSKWNNTHNEFSFTVQHDEIIAFKAILKFFYSSNLPQDIPINELFKMFRLSDILIADYIMRSIERRILAISNNVIQNNDLISYFDLNFKCKYLNQKFQEMLTTRLGDLQTLIMHQDDLFLQLPVRGIIALFSQDRLSLSCENEVLRLLVIWITKNEYVGEDLRNYVRVCHLDKTIINQVLEHLDCFQFTSIEKTVACAYDADSNATTEDIPSIWCKQRHYTTRLPSFFFLSTVIIRKDENSKVSYISHWRGYSVSCNVQITTSNAITGRIVMEFPKRYNEMMPVSVLVIYKVKINDDEHGPFQQMTCNTANIMWREEPLSYIERKIRNCVEINVCELHF